MSVMAKGRAGRRSAQFNTLGAVSKADLGLNLFLKILQSAPSLPQMCILRSNPASRDRRGASVWLAAALVGLAVAPIGAAQAAGVEAAGASVCLIKAFAIDRDPKGSNIRSAPRADAPVIAHLPPLWHLDPSTLAGAEFEVVGSRDGWLLIQNPKAVQYDNKTARLFDGQGWISGALVAVTIDDGPLLARPSADAPVVAKSENGSYDVKRVHGCLGKFVEVTATPNGGKATRGWSRRSCASQLTTCDNGSL
jgi:hypothetical protein